MKKLLGLLLFLSIIYVGIQLSFKYLGKGHTITYSINSGEDKFYVIEKYVQNTKNEFDNYFFEIEVNSQKFNFQTMYDFKKNDMVIKDIKYYVDQEYSCLLPVFNKGVVIDMLCKKENIYYDYNSIKNKNKLLDEFVLSLKDIYDFSKFEDNLEKLDDTGDISVYSNNLLNNHIIALNNYKGLYIVKEASKRVFNVNLFEDDTYKRPLSALVGKTYISADYSDKYNIKKFFLVDIEYNDVDEINFYEGISYNSYIQGIVNNSIYLLNLDNNIQYEIDVVSKTIVEVGNKFNGYKIFKDKFEIMNFDEVVPNKIKFNNFGIVDELFKWGTEKSGYYYKFEKNGDKYKVYRTSIVDNEEYKFLFELKDIDRIFYVDDYVYFIDGEYLKYYHDEHGLRTLIKNSEFQFNDMLIFGIFVK